MDWSDIEAAYVSHAVSQRSRPPPSLGQLPDLLLGGSVPKFKAGKAPGTTLGTSAVKMAVPEIAFHSYALALKAATMRCEPLRCRAA